jgi:hypothetical protein
MIRADKIESRKMPEYVIYIFLWMIFLVIPLITANYNFKWDFVRICYDWLRLVPFIIVFLLNSIWLLPKLLFRGRTILYVLVLISAALFITTTFQIIGPDLHKYDPRLIEQRILQDPQWGRGEMNPAAPDRKNTGLSILSTLLFARFSPS